MAHMARTGGCDIRAFSLRTSHHSQNGLKQLGKGVMACGRQVLAATSSRRGELPEPCCTRGEAFVIH